MHFAGKASVPSSRPSGLQAVPHSALPIFDGRMHVLTARDGGNAGFQEQKPA